MTDLVIFDIDGTLTSFLDKEEACFSEAVQNILGVSDFNRDWGTYKNVTFSGFINEIIEEKLDRALAVGELERFESEFIRLYEPVVRSGDPASRAIPGANQMLKHLDGIENLQLAIATGNWRRVAEMKLEGAGINVDGIFMATSSDAVSREAIMKKAEQMAIKGNGGHSFETITYVGDGEWDAIASRNLNYDFIGISTKISKAVFESQGAKAVFDDYTDLEAFVKAILKPG